MFKKVNSIRQYENIIDQIIALVKQNKLKPNDRLPPERVLAEAFSVSRGSLREAFRILESRRLIESKQGKGRYIKAIDEDSFLDTKNIILNLNKSSLEELLEARKVFETKIAELAAYRATDKEIQMIERTIPSKNIPLKRQIEKKGYEIQKDAEFHLAIAKASHNFIFINIIKLHLDLLKEVREKTWEIKERRANVIAEHHLILEAIKHRNGKQAAFHMRNHLKNIKSTLSKI